jgi:DNA-binding CsgD family transcriptional regulator
LRSKADETDRAYVELLRENLQDIASPFINKLSKRTALLTPRELEVANLIRAGRSSKEIADVLSIAPGTVIQQRKSIRRKLKISGKKVNLRSYLQTL